jgi:hypothetical protein
VFDGANVGASPDQPIHELDTPRSNCVDQRRTSVVIGMTGVSPSVEQLIDHLTRHGVARRLQGAPSILVRAPSVRIIAGDLTPSGLSAREPLLVRSSAAIARRRVALCDERSRGGEEAPSRAGLPKSGVWVVVFLVAFELSVAFSALTPCPCLYCGVCVGTGSRLCSGSLARASAPTGPGWPPIPIRARSSSFGR